MYIRSAAAISPQQSFSRLLVQPEIYRGNRLACVEPDYSRLIDAKMIRRMSRIIKLGVAAALNCLQEAGHRSPDAIITGTAYGCLADTDLFLTKMTENREELLTPTSFIQSTHNTVGAQIALLLKCHAYNNTFVHRGFSFESAMLDAVTLMEAGEADQVLVGAVDEITDTSHAILTRLGLYKKNISSNLELFDRSTKGTVAGEGAAFFLLQRSASRQDYAKLVALQTFYRPLNHAEIRDAIHGFLSAHSVRTEEIDLWITGKNGDLNQDGVFNQLETSLLNEIPSLNYKQYCGEYPTSAAFALWLASNILKHGRLPPPVQQSDAPLKYILIYNHYQNIHHSLYLLAAC